VIGVEIRNYQEFEAVKNSIINGVSTGAIGIEDIKDDKMNSSTDFVNGYYWGKSEAMKEIGMKCIELLEIVQESTGMDIEELIYLKNREDF
jgi:hypothetical protein